MGREYGVNHNVLGNRLRAQKDQEKPSIAFPEGCYGAANAPLVFVGPSPGGVKVDSESVPRRADGDGARWNRAFNEPFEEWSHGFRTSLKPIIEALLQMPLAEGADRLFAFVNFGWRPNPNSSNVQESEMRAGRAVVLDTLEKIAKKKGTVPFSWGSCVRCR